MIKIPESILNAFTRLRASVGLPTLIIIALLGGYFFYSIVRDWRLQQETELQNQRIEKYSQQANAAIADAQNHLQKFEETHKTTVALLDVVHSLSENVKKLAENDRVIEFRVNNLGNEYDEARNPNNTKKSNNSGRSNVPLRQREDSVLSADRELYGN